MEAIEGTAGSLYVAAWMKTADPSHRGLDAKKVSRDALAAVRDGSARARLRLATVAVRAGAAVPRARARLRRSSAPARRPALRIVGESPGRPGGPL